VTGLSWWQSPALPAGQYAFDGERLEPISTDLIQRRHVIAINQAVYDRAAFGVSVISRTRHGWRRYIDLGRTLHRLSMNDRSLGFMSSGYSSHGGDDLPSARVIDGILRDAGRPTGPSYFFLGGRVSDGQRRHEGMNEDVVHMRGPAEMIRDDLANFLPDYMIPNKVVVLDALPTTANGKIDVKALAASDAITADASDRPFVAPRSTTERRIADLWKRAMKRDTVSAQDDFFATGGNSLIAVTLINRINREFGLALPLQVLFESPTIEGLARRVDGADASASRLVPLRADGTGTPIFCWPGLGGYTINLRPLAGATTERPFYGVQTYGVNAGEEPYPTIRQMAAEDVRAAPSSRSSRTGRTRCGVTRSVRGSPSRPPTSSNSRATRSSTCSSSPPAPPRSAAPTPATAAQATTTRPSSRSCCRSSPARSMDRWWNAASLRRRTTTASPPSSTGTCRSSTPT
jgi:hypothetical protein